MMELICNFQDGRPTTPNNGRPKTSPVRRPGSSRPGNMARPRTAAPTRANTEQSELSLSVRERPSSARDRPMTSMGMHNDADADGPVVVTIETVATLDASSAAPQDTQA